MAFKVLLDANVLIDFFLKRGEFEITEKLFDGIFNNRFKVFVTPAILHITAYYTKKILGSAVSKALLLDFLDNSTVIDCNHKTAVLALSSKMTDVEDALQYYTALQHDLNFVITQDQQFQKQAIPSLPIYSPQEFLKTFIE
ncbi:PIN domain-containing protein [uncultured Mucilaginibacter sp.]|uniref:type II toxin-antitoxin system VapC family toxin n=1 Tax=uncultured Mucilaginibacter sp. TaxID=797541 RepID=UPI00262C4DED|nr:PIN domain-containing protein [uncultured Mucilaginibacter sp.]